MSAGRSSARVTPVFHCCFFCIYDIMIAGTDRENNSAYTNHAYSYSVGEQIPNSTLQPVTYPIQV